MSEIIIKTLEDIDEAKGILDTLPLARKSGKSVSWRLTCVQYKERRSADQNSLMWLWWQELEDLNGTPKEGYHEKFKDILCPEKPIKIFDDVVMVKSTALLDTLEFTKYLDTIHQYIFSRYGHSLPIPPETRYDEMENR